MYESLKYDVHTDTRIISSIHATSFIRVFSIVYLTYLHNKAKGTKKNLFKSLGLHECLQNGRFKTLSHL